MPKVWVLEGTDGTPREVGLSAESMSTPAPGERLIEYSRASWELHGALVEQNAGLVRERNEARGALARIEATTAAMERLALTLVETGNDHYVRQASIVADQLEAIRFALAGTLGPVLEGDPVWTPMLRDVMDLLAQHRVSEDRYRQEFMRGARARWAAIRMAGVVLGAESDNAVRALAEQWRTPAPGVQVVPGDRGLFFEVYLESTKRADHSGDCCSICGSAGAHKIGEELTDQSAHEATTVLCRACFGRVFMCVGTLGTEVELDFLANALSEWGDWSRDWFERLGLSKPLSWPGAHQAREGLGARLAHSIAVDGALETLGMAGSNIWIYVYGDTGEFWAQRETMPGFGGSAPESQGATAADAVIKLAQDFEAARDKP